MPEIEAYQTINQLSVTIRDLNIVGNVLDRAVTFGSNQIGGGISYSIDKPASLRDEVRKKAVADALRKAQIFAQAAGFTLGPIIQFSEGGSFGPNHAEPSHKHAILILRLATLQLSPMHLET